MRTMLPVLDAALRPTAIDTDPPRILAHVMSNSGAVSLIATAMAHRLIRGVEMPLPHALLVADSVPGGFDFWRELGRWSRALALATAPAAWVPMPVWAGQAVWAVLLTVIQAVVTISGRTVGWRCTGD